MCSAQQHPAAPAMLSIWWVLAQEAHLITYVCLSRPRLSLQQEAWASMHTQVFSIWQGGYVFRVRHDIQCQRRDDSLLPEPPRLRLPRPTISPVLSLPECARTHQAPSCLNYAPHACALQCAGTP